MQNRTRVARGSCKILRHNIITNTLAYRSIFSARRCKTRHILQYSRTAKCDFAVKRACTAGGTKFRFKFIRRYGANLLNLYAQLNKFHSKFYAAEYVSTRSQNIPQMQLHYKTRLTKHRAPNSSSHRLRCTNFDVRHGRSHCKLAATYDRNTPLPAFSVRRTFQSCTHARQANTPTVSLARATINASYRQGAI